MEILSVICSAENRSAISESNGHGRAAPSQSPTPNIGNLIVRSKQSFSSDELKKKLVDLCRQNNLPFGYYVVTLAGPILGCFTASIKMVTRNSFAEEF